MTTKIQPLIEVPRVMNSKFCILFAVWIALAAVANQSLAVTVPFIEDFTNDTANWADNAQASISHFAAGGPNNDPYVSSSVAFIAAPPGMDAVVAFRGEALFGASGNAFVGSWSAMGVGQVTAYFRHFGPEPLTPFLRVATAGNFPGVAIVGNEAIPAAEWRLLTFDIDPANPLLTVEGPPSAYNTVFGNVGNVQFGVEIPDHLVGDETPIRFDLDRVTIRVPEPASAGLLLAAIVSTSVCLRRRYR